MSKLRGDGQIHGTRGTTRYHDLDARSARNRRGTALAESHLAVAFDDLIAKADELLQEAGVTDPNLLEPDEVLFTAAEIAELEDDAAAFRGDLDAIKRVCERNEGRDAHRYPAPWELGIDDTPPLRRRTFMDLDEEHDRIDTTTRGCVGGFHITTLPGPAIR